MTRTDMETLARFQLTPNGTTRRKIDDLNDLVCELTQLSQTRDGIHTFRQHYGLLVEPMKKLHDIVIEFKGE